MYKKSPAHGRASVGSKIRDSGNFALAPVGSGSSDRISASQADNVIPEHQRQVPVCSLLNEVHGKFTVQSICVVRSLNHAGRMNRSISLKLTVFHSEQAAEFNAVHHKKFINERVNTLVHIYSIIEVMHSSIRLLILMKVNDLRQRQFKTLHWFTILQFHQ
ncbi:hypothetical protein [Pantoea sp.]|uniref:hypothetical protein n=1 Tax=Pantoea sp. TaxID=69393 RepID=UPI00290CAEF4|nr:hypothetical protein [Pantoea sp.]MDU4129738.1 hypothetical protein [Pantoea sp.]